VFGAAAGHPSEGFAPGPLQTVMDTMDGARRAKTAGVTCAAQTMTSAET
jgi:hypothetical protein